MSPAANRDFSPVKTWPASAHHGSVGAASSGFFEVFVGLGSTDT